MGSVPASVNYTFFVGTLLFVRSRPVVFWTLYLLCGLSDVLDGAIARRTGTASRLGEKQDTFADIVFVAIWIAIFIPAINVGDWLKKIMAF